MIDRPLSTVRRWLRRLPPKHLERMCRDGTRHLLALDPDTFTVLRYRGNMLAHTLSLLSAAAYWDRRRYGAQDPPWTVFHYDGANGWYPGGWPTEDELRWFPDDLIDKYGGVIEKYNGTADHTGLHYDQLHFPGDAEPDAVAEDLRRRGDTARRSDSGDLADWLGVVGA